MSSAGSFRPPRPFNESIRSYAPGSAERRSLQARLAQLAGEQIEMPLVIGGRDVRNGRTVPAVMPHRTTHVLGSVHWAGQPELEQAIRAAGDAWPD
ncbi:MAG TPA: 1-pyrroline-5-carboxylate dehydrogenase, partial [Candidatus Dormibacteraeota bacterium]